MHTHTTVEIDAPAGVIFPWITDGDKVSQWVSNLVSDEAIEEKEGHVGSRFRQMFSENGREFEMEGEVLRWEQDRLVAVRMTCSMFDMELCMTIDPIADGRHQITQDGHIHMKGLLKIVGLLFGWMMKKKACKQGQDDLNTLKRLCEEDAAAGAPG